MPVSVQTSGFIGPVFSDRICIIPIINGGQLRIDDTVDQEIPDMDFQKILPVQDKFLYVQCVRPLQNNAGGLPVYKYFRSLPEMLNTQIYPGALACPFVFIRFQRKRGPIDAFAGKIPERIPFSGKSRSSEKRNRRESNGSKVIRILRDPSLFR